MALSFAAGPKGRAAFRGLALAALVAGFLQVTLGGVVRVSDSGLGCPDWPLCHGRIIPPFDVATLIEYSHRLSASVLGALVLAVAVLAWVMHRSATWVLVPSGLGLIFVILAAALGGVTVLTELAWQWVIVHLAVAEALVACMVLVTVASRRRSGSPSASASAPEIHGWLNTLVLATLLGTFVLVLSGSYMVGYGAGSSCATWPLCQGSLIPGGGAYMIHMAHRFVAALVGVLIAATVVSAWSRRDSAPGLARASVLLAGVFIVQILLGAAMIWTGFGSHLKALHLSMATLVWVALVVVAAILYVPKRSDNRGVVPAIGRVSRLERLIS